MEKILVTVCEYESIIRLYALWSMLYAFRYMRLYEYALERLRSAYAFKGL